MQQKRPASYTITPRDIHAGEINTHLQRIDSEFREGFKFLARYPKSVTFFGSSLASPEGTSYLQAQSLASRIVDELGYTIITGGGPGIMEAANKGASQAGGASVGLTISLPHNRSANNYVDESMHFGYFFSRKAMLTFAAEAYIFFPGGYGTMDELFSILTLVQTNKIPRVPIILFDPAYWNALTEFMRRSMLNDYKAINEDDLNLMEITDSPDRVIELIKASPIREWSRNIN